MIPQTLAGSRSGRRVPAANPQPARETTASPLPPQPPTLDADLFNARYADSPASRDALLQKVPLKRFGQPEDIAAVASSSPPTWLLMSRDKSSWSMAAATISRSERDQGAGRASSCRRQDPHPD